MLNEAGMRLKDIEVYQQPSGKHLFTGVWEAGSGKFGLYRHNSWTKFVDHWKTLATQGLRLIDIERIKVGSTYWYYGVYSGGNDAYGLYRYNSWDEFTKKFNELKSQGLTLVDVDASEVNGTTTYIGVWRSGSAHQIVYNFSSWNNLVNNWKTLTASHYAMRDMDVLRLDSGATQYVAVFTADKKGKQHLYQYQSWNSFKKRWAKLAEAGYSLHDVEVARHGSTNSNIYIGTYGPGPNTPNNGPDLETMGNNIENALNGSVVGLAYAIGQNGQLAYAGNSGFAQRWPDPTINMDSKARSTVASVTKAVTAPLLYRLLDDNNLTVDSPIAPWLPSSWTLGSGFTNDNNGVSFRHLLTHTSGLSQARAALQNTNNLSNWDTDWDGLRFIVRNGTSPGSARRYLNANFALMRIIIPELWKEAGGHSQTVTRANADQLYLQYLNQVVSAREGISTIDCVPQAGFTEIKAYNFGNAGLAGWSNGVVDREYCGGHAELYMSAQDITRYAMSFRYNNDIMTNADRQIMDSNLAGWNNQFFVQDGTAFGHGGFWQQSNERIIRTCMLQLPNGVNASLIINSNSAVHPCTILTDAYNAAF